ncbi:MAG: hypothetical protein KDD82_29050 [Planctomycetes bacterium]|nr:hypothetical protein [Planctomycetota bacterium]
MLDQILIGALGRSETLRSLVEGELQRLSEEGFLSAADVAELRDAHAQRLRELAAGAGGQASQALRGLGSSLRAALDLPSRAEVLALTEELRLARARAAEGPSP